MPRLSPTFLRSADDQDQVALVAQVLWACQADLVALLGLPGPAISSKACALLNLWDQSNGAGEACMEGVEMDASSA